MDRGYPKESAIRFVSDHHRLLEEQRFMLTRVVFASDTAEKRRDRILPLEALHGRALFIDGYNVLISVESLLGGKPVYLCDDGFLRDIQGIFRSYRPSDLTAPALDAIFDLLARACPAVTEVLLDQQISMSGRLAVMTRMAMAEHDVPGMVRTAQDVDRQLKKMKGVIATGDGAILDAAVSVVDIPGAIARMNEIEPMIF
ncbi:Uncharacterised protein [uncultured archaeon]|nr:Uncharacterised protein [uncultured archaeon]